MASYHGHAAKPRKTKVKPISRKLAASQTRKDSRDLDRSAGDGDRDGDGDGDGDGLGIEYGHSYGIGSGHSKININSNGHGNGFGRPYSRSSHDVQIRRGYYSHSHSHSHDRSTSGTSQFSPATTGSGHRTESFVHPFEQTPRPYTPPIAASASCQNSLRESELHNSQGLVEDEDHIHQSHIHHLFRSPLNISNHTSPPSTTDISSSPNLSHPQPLQIQSSKQASSSRLTLATSHTSLQLSSEIASPTDTMSPASVIRNSLDKVRNRSRSELDVDTYAQSIAIREARRKFKEREDFKDEKFAREEIRALEKRQYKEACQMQRGERRASAKRSKAVHTVQEKDGFVGWDYNYLLQPQPQTPTVAEAEEEQAVQLCQLRRSGTVKYKMHCVWIKFVMWIRTRFIYLCKDY